MNTPLHPRKSMGEEPLKIEAGRTRSNRSSMFSGLEKRLTANLFWDGFPVNHLPEDPFRMFSDCCKHQYTHPLCREYNPWDPIAPKLKLEISGQDFTPLGDVMLEVTKLQYERVKAIGLKEERKALLTK